MCGLLSPPVVLGASVLRTYTVGVRCKGETPRRRRMNEVHANGIIAELQNRVAEKITVQMVDAARTLVQEQPAFRGTKGAAYLAQKVADRSNLEQIAYLEVLNKSEGLLAQEHKVQIFLDMLEGYPEEAVCWFVFGRTPFLEKRLQYESQVKYEYARNLILSGRRVLDTFLPSEDKLTGPLPVLETFELQQAIVLYNQTIHQHFAEQEATGKPLTNPQKVFKKRLEEVAFHQTLVASELQTMLLEWNIPSDDTPASRWKLLKRTARNMQELLPSGIITAKNHFKYLSVLRGILVTAFLPYYAQGETVLGLKAAGVLCVEHLVRKPFIKQILAGRPWKLPLTLIMGPKYVVERPGNAQVLTKLGKTQGSFPIKIFEPEKRKQGIVATVILSPSVRQFLAAGATIKTLIVVSGTAPACKLTVKIILSGRIEWFFSQKEIEKTDPLVLTEATNHVDALGVDINRPGKNIIAFSEPVKESKFLQTLCTHYECLEGVIQQLSKAFTEVQKATRQNPSTENKRHVLKLRGELTRVYARRKRLLREIVHEVVRYLTTVFLQTRCPIGCFEELALTARETKGALAKAILLMPDDRAILYRLMLLYEWITGKKLLGVLIPPQWTSQGEHLDCPITSKGRVRRSGKYWDTAPCLSCHLLVDTQLLAARHIKLRGIQWLKKHSLY